MSEARSVAPVGVVPHLVSVDIEQLKTNMGVIVPERSANAVARVTGIGYQNTPFMGETNGSMHLRSLNRTIELTCEAVYLGLDTGNGPDITLQLVPQEDIDISGVIIHFPGRSLYVVYSQLETQLPNETSQGGNRVLPYVAHVDTARLDERGVNPHNLAYSAIVAYHLGLLR